MAELDFRYTLDGKEVEAFQVTEDSRYQERLWPDWMHSKMLLTYDGKEYLKWGEHKDEEMAIPEYGWLVRSANGDVRAVGYEVMETAIKLVEDPGPKRDAPTEVDEDSLIELQAAMQKRDPDEIRAERAAKAAKQPPPELSVVEPEVTGQIRNIDHSMDKVHVTELVTILELFVEGETSAGIKALKSCLLQRVTWCSCAPGNCEGGDRLGCRVNSPLT